MAELNERVSILEVKFENMEDTLKRLMNNHAEHFDTTLQIKERLDKQNGAIPHMSEDIRAMTLTQNKMFSRMNSDKIKSENLDVKFKILWAGLAIAAGAVLTHFIHVLLK